MTRCVLKIQQKQEKSKELIESCCKTIIESFGEDIKESISVGQLVKQTLNLLNIPNKMQKWILKKIGLCKKLQVALTV